jgi:2-polyprenyl-6-hydroxyphenyl methylase/3-demethylubiquinone-9 3-methyltransferase
MAGDMEIDAGERFAFGRNWKNYSSLVDESRIGEAQQAMLSMLGVDSMEGRSFLDIGCGSGLMSLAAARLGARVVSFDYDQDSVDCTCSLKERFASDVDDWEIGQGSVLDQAYMAALGTFDIVYSWGVLHHTGNMEIALRHAVEAVGSKGILFISIYNDQGGKSLRWRLFKRVFIRCPHWLQFLLCIGFLVFWELRLALARAVRLKNPLPFDRWGRSQGRGMSLWYDAWDWLGGYPFEVAKPEEIFDFCKSKGFVLQRLSTCGGGKGCNEYVFGRVSGGCRDHASV